MLNRIKKKSASAATTDDSSRSQIPRQSKGESLECVLCENSDVELREAMTMKVNGNVNMCKNSQ